MRKRSYVVLHFYSLIWIWNNKLSVNCYQFPFYSIYISICMHDYWFLLHIHVHSSSSIHLGDREESKIYIAVIPYKNNRLKLLMTAVHSRATYCFSQTSFPSLLAITKVSTSTPWVITSKGQVCPKPVTLTRLIGSTASHEPWLIDLSTVMELPLVWRLSSSVSPDSKWMISFTSVPALFWKVAARQYDGGGSPLVTDIFSYLSWLSKRSCVYTAKTSVFTVKNRVLCNNPGALRHPSCTKPRNSSSASVAF